MRICMVAEGCYPYVVGGVSSWINSLIHLFPQHEFILLSIVADRSVRGKFVYELPDNVTEVYELYLVIPVRFRSRIELIFVEHFPQPMFPRYIRYVDRREH